MNRNWLVNGGRIYAGFSLIEMMIALVLGLIVSSAVVAFLLSSMKSNGEYVQSTRLTQELRNILDLVTLDLSRAGYNDDALDLDSLPVASPFSPVWVKDVSPRVMPGTLATYANADLDGCVLYAYDRTYPVGYETACDSVAGCGAAGMLDLANAEIRGVRRICLDGACDGEADDVGVIEYAESAAGVTPSCAGAPADYSNSPSVCNAASGWCGLSDPRMFDITRFMVVNTSGELSSSMQIRDLVLHLEGRLRHGGDFSRAVTSEIKIRADCVDPSLASCNAAPSP